MSFKTSDAYRNVIEKARWSHDNHRSVFHIDPQDVALARLYAYGFRSQAIGGFHATRQGLGSAGGEVTEHRRRAMDLLKQLADQAMVPVPTDFRAAIHVLYYYDRWICEVIDVLEAACTVGQACDLEPIKDRFIAGMERITGSGGIYVAGDTVVPEQASFVVPNLKITIVPVIYGDHHSWNFAHLAAHGPGVTTHRHREGAEIHLGYSPIYGRSILGKHCTILREGYAMPIPAMMDHGFKNLSGHDHIVPFVFGSLTLSGWGVFFDVEPRPLDSSKLAEVPLDSQEMNHSVYLEREIQQMTEETATGGRVLIPAAATQSGCCGGLELGIARVDQQGLDLASESYRIVSVCKGMAQITIGPASAELAEHDHVGVPAGLDARIVQAGQDPLVVLDATIHAADER